MQGEGALAAFGRDSVALKGKPMDKRQLIALLRGSIQFERDMTQINSDLRRQLMQLNERYRSVSEDNARLHAFLLAGLTLTAEQRHLYEHYQTELPFSTVLTILADSDPTLSDQYTVLEAEDEHLREQQD